MRITRNWAPARYPVHLCLLDLDCWRDYREFHAPMRLYLHFLVNKRGHGVFIDVWGKRRSERYLQQLFKVDDVRALSVPKNSEE